jgi:hypothetical protein
MAVYLDVQRQLGPGLPLKPRDAMRLRQRDVLDGGVTVR